LADPANPVASVVLYGSRARGDHDDGSDTDLLAVTDGGPPAVVSLGGLTVARYPLGQVLGRARSGDLFALHVVCEGRAVYERQPVLAAMKRAFRYRQDYTREVGMASDVGWFLLHHRARAACDVAFNRRMAWCAHTLIAARAATARRPVFSAAGLAAFAGSSAVETVIRDKNSPVVAPEVVERFGDVLREFGTPEPTPLPTLRAEWRRFNAGRNPAGPVAIRAMLRATGGSVNPTDGGGAGHDHS
jgi:predicted nucleotidyltransferase